MGLGVGAEEGGKMVGRIFVGFLLFIYIFFNFFVIKLEAIFAERRSGEVEGGF